MSAQDHDNQLGGYEDKSTSADITKFQAAAIIRAYKSSPEFVALLNAVQEVIKDATNCKGDYYAGFAYDDYAIPLKAALAPFLKEGV